MSLSEKFKSLLKNMKYGIEYFGIEYFKEETQQYIQSLQDDVTIKTDDQQIRVVNGKNILPPTIERKKKPLKITSLDEYRVALKEGIKDFDFSDLDIEGENIQDLNLENLHLHINLRNIFVPFRKCHNVIYVNWEFYGDCFLRLNKSNLKGNQVEGDLSFFHSKSEGDVYFWYTENTFDEIYKEKYPQYFLDDNAPEYLKDKYYNPTVVTKVIPTIFHADGEEVTYLTRTPLSFEEYMEHYQFLTEKYLGNFDIPKIDYAKIIIVERYGLEQAKEIFRKLSQFPLPIDTVFQSLAEMDQLNVDDRFLTENEANNALKVKQILNAMKNPGNSYRQIKVSQF